MPDPKPEEVRIPRAALDKVVAFLQAATRRLADTPGVETQALAIEGEAVLLELVAAWAQADIRRELWGPAGRPAMPGKKLPEIPAEVKT